MNNPLKRLRRYYLYHFPDFNRREKFYFRCQEIVDYLHFQIAKGKFVPHEECFSIFGETDYTSFLNELKLMNISTDSRESTPATEWMYYSQYFTYKAAQERNSRTTYALSLISFAFSIIALIISVF